MSFCDNARTFTSPLAFTLAPSPIKALTVLLVRETSTAPAMPAAPTPSAGATVRFFTLFAATTVTDWPPEAVPGRRFTSAPVPM